MKSAHHYNLEIFFKFKMRTLNSTQQLRFRLKRRNTFSFYRDNNPNGINLPRLWLLFFLIEKTYRVTSGSYDNKNHHQYSSKVGTTTTPQFTACDSLTRPTACSKKSKRPFTLNGNKSDRIEDSQQEAKLALA